jgi:hypothetical protein
LICFFFLTVSAAYTQSQWFATVGVGPINYCGDLLDKHFTFKEMKLSGMAGITYQSSHHYSVNFSLMQGKIGASDSKNGPKWFYRNLSFESNIFEVAVTGEYDLFDIAQIGGAFADQNTNKFTPYLFAGLGIFHFNPYTYDISGNKVYLQPLGTEGETTPYSLWQVSIPFGIGAKYRVSNTVILSGEISFRKTFTDYIDDVSQHQYPDSVALAASHGQEAASLSYRADEIPNSPYKIWGYRGNPNKKDDYYTFTIKASFQLFTHRPKFYYGY